LIKDDKFLILGYKGSGKSAIGERLGLLQDRRRELYVKLLDLEEFPFRAFGRIVGGSLETEARYPVAWSWLLLVTLLDSFSIDERLISTDDQDLEPVLTILRQLGLLPAVKIKELALTSSKRSIKAQIPKLVEGALEQTYQGGDVFAQVAALLKRLMLGFKTPNRHLLIIDGLDDILTRRNVQYDSLAALVNEIDRLNADFQLAGVPCKILLLCRTDLFERLPSANKNKVRQDYTIELDWYQDPREPEKSRLLRLIGLRAELAGAKPDPIDAYFPTKLEDRPIKSFLLDHTRHTPRDLIKLLTSIQGFATSRNLSKNQVLNGLRHYSLFYFRQEIEDELVGYLTDEERENAIPLLAAVRAREFNLGRLRAASLTASNWQSLDIEKILRVLFDCSAIGNVQYRGKNTTYFTFKYRNRMSTLNFDESILIHRGLWKSMNLI
jgi:hypothetical protein